MAVTRGWPDRSKEQRQPYEQRPEGAASVVRKNGKGRGPCSRLQANLILDLALALALPVLRDAGGAAADSAPLVAGDGDLFSLPLVSGIHRSGLPTPRIPPSPAPAAATSAFWDRCCYCCCYLCTVMESVLVLSENKTQPLSHRLRYPSRPIKQDEWGDYDRLLGAS